MFVTLWNKSSNEGVSLWAGGLDPVSVVLAVGLGSLGLIWLESTVS